MHTHRRTFGSSNGGSEKYESASDDDALRGKVSSYDRRSIKTIVSRAMVSLIIATAAFALPGSVPVTAYAQAATGPIDVWWPTASATLSGVQPFKAMLEGADVNSYYLFWEVDGGQYNLMPTNTQDYPHKEAEVNVAGWNWEPSGDYEITFIAQNLQGQEIARTSVTVHVANGAADAAAVATPVATVSVPAPAPAVAPAPPPPP